jgi:glucokinase
LALAIDAHGDVIGESRVEWPAVTVADQGASTADALAGQLTELARELSVAPQDFSVGIGLPGLVRRDGRLAYAPNLQQASGADLPRLLADRLGPIRVAVENDGNCAALAEHEWGAGRGAADFVMVTLGTGIGGGIIVNHDVVRGHNGFGGEIGHMIVEAGGVLCECGVRGCWERYASGSGLARLTKEWVDAGRLSSVPTTHPEVTSHDVTAAADSGNHEAITLLEQLGWWVAVGVANLAVIFDAQRFVVGGGLWSAADHYLPAAARALSELTEGVAYRDAIELIPATLGVRAGALGAALVARRAS